MRVKIIIAAIPVTVMFAVAALGGTARAQTPPPTLPAAALAHNVVIFVADGLRFRSVDDGTAPNMAMLARQGASLVNGHSLFPTLTMANASAIATGHLLGDTGVFANTLYAGFPVPAAAGSPTPFIENDAVLGDLDSHFGGDLLNQDTIFKLARDKGYSTAAIGKVGPTLLFDHTERSGLETIIIDDFTGTGSRDSGCGASDGAFEGRRPCRRDALTRRQRCRRRCDDARHHGRQCGAAGLFRRRRDPRRPAPAGVTRQTVPVRILVTRSGRHAA